MWFGFGWVNVGMGGLGAVLPGLPSVVFFIVAAYSFSRSSPRFERWVLGLPGIGPMVADYRAGLGMARRAKFVAIASVVVFGSISAIVAYQRPWLSALIAVLCFVGILTIVFAVPLRERVLLERARTGNAWHGPCGRNRRRGGAGLDGRDSRIGRRCQRIVITHPARRDRRRMKRARRLTRGGARMSPRSRPGQTPR